MSLSLLKKRFSKVVREGRSALNLSQQDLSDSIGVSLSTIKRMESGADNALSVYLLAIARVNPKLLQRMYSVMELDVQDFTTQPMESLEMMVRIEKTNQRRRNRKIV